MLSQGLPKIILESVFARYVLRVKYQDQDRAMILQEMTFNMVSRVIIITHWLMNMFWKYCTFVASMNAEK